MVDENKIHIFLNNIELKSMKTLKSQGVQENSELTIQVYDNEALKM